MLDQTDIAILNLLKENSRRQWKEIGEKVHLTGQAVATRVLALEVAGVIERFTVRLNNAKLGKPITAFITVFMRSTDHAALEKFLDQQPAICEAHRVSGEGCYLLKAALASHEDLNQLLSAILKFGNYRVNLSIGEIKTQRR